MNIPDNPTPQEAFSIVRHYKPEAPVAICADLWAPPNQASSSVEIWDGETHHRAKTLRAALVLFVATIDAREGSDETFDQIANAIAEQEAAQ